LVIVKHTKSDHEIGEWRKSSVLVIWCRYHYYHDIFLKIVILKSFDFLKDPRLVAWFEIWIIPQQALDQRTISFKIIMIIRIPCISLGHQSSKGECGGCKYFKFFVTC
jgi:hypothetical protein